jgi:hypothetical protein
LEKGGIADSVSYEHFALVTPADVKPRFSMQQVS